MGLIDALKIWRDNFAYWSKYLEFINHFSDLFVISGIDLDNIRVISNERIKAIIIEILVNLDIFDENECLFGKTTIFLKNQIKI